MKQRTLRLSTVAFVALMFAACGGEPEMDTAEAPAAPAPAPAGPAVMITEPANGAVIEGGSVLVKLEVSGVVIAPAGTMDAGTGHHHLMVDTDLPAAGAPIPSTPGVHIHMGAAQTEMQLTDLAPGDHTVIAVVGDGVHVPLSPWVADTVRFTVR